MGRPPRIEQAGAIHHVTARGNAQADIFRTTHDARVFLEILGFTIPRRGWRCLAYCLMPNHYHLLVETPTPNLSEGMHALNSRYARGFNAVHARVGHVFQGRFHAAAVQRDEHLHAAIRYIAHNPVDAGIVGHPAAWRWSSHRATAGVAIPPDWLAVDDVHRLFGTRAAYWVFVEGTRQVPLIHPT
jgi:putative transposase